MNRWVLISCCLLLPSPADAVQEDGSDSAPLERYLARHGLVDLQVLHFEDKLDETRQPDAKIELGKRLANLYTIQLTRSAGNDEKHARILSQVERLLVMVPESDTPALQTLILQAHHARAELKLLKWFEDRGNIELLQQANELLTDLSPRFAQQIKQAEDRIGEISDLILSTTDEKKIQALELESDQLRVVSLRATYFSAWSHFYLAACSPISKQGDDALSTAIDHFRNFLGIDSGEKYSELEEDWLGLETPLRARVMLGLGLANMGLDSWDNAKICFAFVERFRTDKATRNELPYWFFQTAISFDQLERAAGYSRVKIDEMGNSATKEKSRFCVSLVRYGFSDVESDANIKLQIGQLGLEGLAKMRQFKLCNELMKREKIDFNPGKNFYLLWLDGFQKFQLAESTKTKSDFQAALESLQNALEQPQANKDLVSGGHCRYQFAWSLYQVAQFEEAAKQFELVVPTLRSTAPETGANAAWMRFQSLQKLADSDQRYTLRAIEALSDLKRDFPASPFAKNADYLTARLKRQSASPQQTISLLEKVKPNDSNYLTALYEICLLKHQVWADQLNARKSTEEEGKELRRSVEVFLLEAGKSTSATRQLKCCLLVVDVALRDTVPNEQLARQFLNRSAPWASSLQSSNLSVIEYHYHLFKLARLNNDDDQIQIQAQWLAENASGSAYQTSALVILAMQADQAVASAGAAERKVHVKKARDLYEKLVLTNGDSVETLQTKKNARISLYQLAKYEQNLGNLTSAAELSRKLIAAFPRDTNYLRLAATSEFELRNYEKSRELWRVLARGLEDPSTGWYEAKYHVIACLVETNQDEASKVYRQFALLHPNIKDTNWRSKFKQLSQRIKK